MITKTQTTKSMKLNHNNLIIAAIRVLEFEATSAVGDYYSIDAIANLVCIGADEFAEAIGRVVRTKQVIAAGKSYRRPTAAFRTI